MNDNPDDTPDFTTQSAPDLTAATKPLLEGITQNATRLAALVERLKEQLQTLEHEKQELGEALVNSQEQGALTEGLQTQLSALQKDFAEQGQQHDLKIAEHLEAQKKLEQAEQEFAEYKTSATQTHNELQLAKQQNAELEEAATLFQVQLQDAQNSGGDAQILASFLRLHESLELSSIVNTLGELLDNIGAQSHAVVLRQDESTFSVASEHNFLEPKVDVLLETVNWAVEGALAQAIRSESVAYSDDNTGAEVEVALPFISGGHCSGAALIGRWREDVPSPETLSLLAKHVSVAMTNAHELARTSRKLKTYEGMLSLLEPS